MARNGTTPGPEGQPDGQVGSTSADADGASGSVGPARALSHRAVPDERGVRASEGAGPPGDGSRKATLATEYFLDGLSKVEIGRRHSLSRFQVARLLDEARDEGIVRIQIVDPSAAGRDYATLAQQLGISSVTVAAARPGESMRAAIARQAARLLTSRLREGGRLGVAWSRTLMHLPDTLEVLPAVDIVQLVGPLSAAGYSTAESSALVHTLGARSGGRVWALPTPLVVDSPQVAASLRAMEEVRTTLDAADALDVAVVSLGAWSAGASTLWARLGADEQRRAQEAGIVAEICGIMLGGTGAVWHSALEDRVIGVRADQLRRARVIAAAPAVGRPEAVIAAARSGLVDDIVLAPELADQVVALLE
ncbi:MAG: Cro/Cl family transcriptional regulator [Brachybacterium sp.]|uniref:sugar-binding transcriptional regulator n=1 Tax=Brachybacterium sp. TaxID=1891286 RepID=UPI0026472934|nr:sugar-binding domain-containing protein [Brachybacterium sp.]MDN5687538.1 Cro/Cl family transcriptional regulator [Brachybacterium sp.]